MSISTYPISTRGAAAMKKSVIRQVTDKRQITIPKEMFNAAGLGSLVELSLEQDGAIMLRAVKDEGWNLAEDVLKGLVAEGLQGPELLSAFSKRYAEIESALDKLSIEVDAEIEANPDAGREFITKLLEEDHDGEK